MARNTDADTWETRAVAAGAYKNLDDERNTLTHVVNTGINKPLCRSVKITSLLDDPHAQDINEIATCPTCRRLDPRATAGRKDPLRATTKKELADAVAAAASLLDGAINKLNEAKTILRTQAQQSSAESVQGLIYSVNDEAAVLHALVASLRNSQ